MKLFIDTANLEDIEQALKRGFVQGITTNPSLLAKEPKAEFKEHIGKILKLIEEHQPGTHLSIEVFSKKPDEILRQANDFAETFKYPHLSIKIHAGWDELEVIKTLSKNGISVNSTCNMSVSQAVMAAGAGAKYVSLFWGRIKDGGNGNNDGEGFSEIRKQLLEDGVLDKEDFDPRLVVEKTRAIFDKSYPNSEIIVGSIRRVTDIIDAGLSGAHIVTVPPKFFPSMISHFKTDQVVDEFFSKFQEWLS